MGSASSRLRESKAFFERRLSDQTRHLKRVLSKSNSMESLDKAEIQDIKQKINQTSAVLLIIDKAIEDEHALSF